MLGCRRDWNHDDTSSPERGQSEDGCLIRPQAATSPTPPATWRFTLPPEQAQVFTKEGSPTCLLGGYQLIGSLMRDEATFLDAVRAGKGDERRYVSSAGPRSETPAGLRGG